MYHIFCYLYDLGTRTKQNNTLITPSYESTLFCYSSLLFLLSTNWHMQFLRFLVLIFSKLIIVVTGCYIDGMFLILSLRNHFFFEEPGTLWCVPPTWFTRCHLANDNNPDYVVPPIPISDGSYWGFFSEVPMYVDKFGTPS